VTASACGISSDELHRVSTSPVGETLTTAPFAAPVRIGSIGRGEGDAAGAGGPARPKLSVTVTSPPGTVAVTGGSTGTLGRASLASLPSMSAAYRLPSGATSTAFTSR
jgi:hypothetical protein